MCFHADLSRCEVKTDRKQKEAQELGRIGQKQPTKAKVFLQGNIAHPMQWLQELLESTRLHTFPLQSVHL